MSIAVHNDNPLRWRVGRREAARFRPRRTRNRVRRPTIVSCSTTTTAATIRASRDRTDGKENGPSVGALSSALSHFVASTSTHTHNEGTEISREKALEESRLLKCASLLLSSFLSLSFFTPFPVEARWPPSRNQGHEEVPHTEPRGLPQVRYAPSCSLRYATDLVLDRYNKLCGSIRSYAHRLSLLPGQDPFRTKMESQLLSKLYDMGVLNTTATLSEIENKLTVAAFCRRRLGVVMHRLNMAESVSAVSAKDFLVDLLSAVQRRRTAYWLNHTAWRSFAPLY